MAQAPVDVYQLADDLGIPVHDVVSKDDDFAGSLTHSGGDYVIRTNRLHHPNRRRFTVAHELGHFFLHRDLIENSITDSVKYRYKPEANRLVQDQHEIEANKFAAGLLMPAHLVKQLLDEGLDVEEIARRLEVSKQALEIRMKSIRR